MRKVELNMKEKEKYEVIKELYQHGGNKRRAALTLGISYRHVNRLLKVYQNKGKAGFVHGNKNQQPVNTLPKELTDRIIQLYLTKYQGFNFKHFQDFLFERENIKLSYSCIYNILTKANIYSPKIRRKTKKELARKKVLKENPKITEKELTTIVNYEVSLESSHPRKEKEKNFGELVQMDASIHNWFGDKKSALHLTIDNATGTILGGYFDYYETLNGYYNVLKQILLKYGVIFKFLTDNRTIFNYQRKSVKKDDNDVLTQFGYACKILGIEIETTSVSQAKGQIERANGTFQGRLVNELRLENISTIEEANEYLINVFIPNFNKKFAQDYTKFPSIVSPAPSEERINLILAVLSPRIIDNGSAIRYMNKYYQAYDENDNLICFKPKTKCLVIRSFDKQLLMTVEEKVYRLVELKKNKTISVEFDFVEEKPKKEKKKYIPPMSHPWRRSSFLTQQERAHKEHKFT